MVVDATDMHIQAIVLSNSRDIGVGFHTVRLNLKLPQFEQREAGATADVQTVGQALQGSGPGYPFQLASA